MGFVIDELAKNGEKAQLLLR